MDDLFPDAFEPTDFLDELDDSIEEDTSPVDIPDDPPAYCNVSPSTIFCHDNLAVLRGINTGCVDLIYLDPPFNKNRTFSAPIGSNAEGAEFRDVFTENEINEAWIGEIERAHPRLGKFIDGLKLIDGPRSYTYHYIIYMAIRLIECRRVLKPSGSIYLHCDDTMNHYLKAVMDIIFGVEAYRNEIIWRRTAAHANSKTRLGRIADHILFYGYTFDREPIKVPYTEEDIKNDFRYRDARGVYKLIGLKHSGSYPGYEYPFSGVTAKWRVVQPTMEKWAAEGRIHNLNVPNKMPKQKLYLNELRGKTPGSIWLDISPARGGARYPTKKPIALLERIIKASSRKGDVVLDPFCGCATACVAAARLGRNYIGIDVSIKAYDLVRDRMTEEVADPNDLLKRGNTISMSTTPPKRTDREPLVSTPMFDSDELV